MNNPGLNVSKNAKSFKEWFASLDATSDSYDKTMIPPMTDYDIANFDEFIQKRKELLKEKIEEIIN